MIERIMSTGIVHICWTRNAWDRIPSLPVQTNILARDTIRVANHERQKNKTGVRPEDGKRDHTQLPRMMQKEYIPAVKPKSPVHLRSQKRPPRKQIQRALRNSVFCRKRT